MEIPYWLQKYGVKPIPPIPERSPEERAKDIEDGLIECLRRGSIIIQCPYCRVLNKKGAAPCCRQFVLAMRDAIDKLIPPQKEDKWKTYPSN